MPTFGAACISRRGGPESKLQDSEHAKLPRLGTTVPVGAMGPLRTIIWYSLAALGEIGGCFAFWAWLRMHRSPAWALPGVASLVAFAYALTRIDAAAAGRAYAAYGGVYILSAIVWLWLVEGVRPDRWDVLGAFVCLTGAMIILYGPRPG